METTQAAQWAERMGGDGAEWTMEHERTLQAEATATHLDDGHVRWTFLDGSTIVEVAGRWDLGLDPRGTRCHCWVGSGVDEGQHGEGCPAVWERRTIRVSWCDDEPGGGWLVSAEGQPGPYCMDGDLDAPDALLKDDAREEAEYHWGAEYADADVEVSR